MKSPRKHRFTTVLTLAAFAWQSIALPVVSAAASDADPEGSQAASYESAIELAENSKTANTIAIGVWGISAAVCGYNCINYLVPFRKKKKALVASAGALTKAGTAAATQCKEAGIGEFATVLGQYEAKIGQLLTASEGSAATAVAEHAKPAGEMIQGVSGGGGGTSAPPPPQRFPSELLPPLSRLMPIQIRACFAWASSVATAEDGMTAQQRQTLIDWINNAPPKAAAPAAAAPPAFANPRPTVQQPVYSHSRQPQQPSNTDYYELQSFFGDPKRAPPTARQKELIDQYVMPKKGEIAPAPPEPAAAVTPATPPPAPEKVEVPAAKAAPEKPAPAPEEAAPEKAIPVAEFAPEEGIAANAKKMVQTAEDAALMAERVAQASRSAGPAGAATATRCMGAAQALRAPGKELLASATAFEAQIKTIVTAGLWCSGAAVVAGVTDAGLSMGLAQDTTAGLIGLAGAAPGVFGLATTLMKKKSPSTAKTASTAGLTSCIATATSLAEVAVKTVGMQNAQESIDENQRSLDELQENAWLRMFQDFNPLATKSAWAATSPTPANACGKTMTSSFESRYSCALSGDRRLRNAMASIPGGGAGLFGAAERIFRFKPDEFLSTQKPVTSGRIISLITRDQPQLAPGLLALQAATERKAAQYLKMNPAQRNQLLELEQRRLSYAAPESPAEGGAYQLGAPAIAEELLQQEDEFASNGASEARAPAAASERELPLPPPPGLGADEISPAEGHSIFELVSRTIRDHRELVDTQ